MSVPGDTRLNSWKEIAAYLERDLRTARRWEKDRALPVHRIPGTGRPTVYAFRSEIDDWLQQSNAVDSGEPTEVPAPPMLGAVILSRPSDGTLRPVSTQAVGDSHQLPAGQSLSESEGAFPSSQIIAPRGKSRHSIGFNAVKAVPSVLVIIALAASVAMVWLARTSGALSVRASSDPVAIKSVSTILPMPDQTIVIRGRGFGMQARYTNEDSPFIAIRDTSSNWAAGRMIPQNWDKVTLDVKSWVDSQIVVSGFSGAYGSQGWKLKAGDKIEVAVWNPQSRRGPALYHLTVSATP